MAGRPKFPKHVERLFWDQIRAGAGLTAACEAIGVAPRWGRMRFREAGGVNPTRVAPAVGRYLSWPEREELAALAHTGLGVVAIARRLGRSPSTIGRELARGDTHRGYRASVGQGKADLARAAPRPSKLATNLPLRAAVVLCDRGTVDGGAYWQGPGSLWDAVGTTLEDEIARYHAVIHLRTPTSPDAYGHENPLRIESLDEAAAIDARIAESWSSHPRRYFVDATPDFLTKAAQSLALLRDQVPPCCRHHVKPFLWSTWPGEVEPHGP